MKKYSITRRLVVTILLAQLVLTGFVTGAELLYLREQHLRTFDIMLRGRADMVFGAVQDANDPSDNVLLDTSAIDVPERDVYEVREESGKVIGRSPNWDGLSTAPAIASDQFRPVKIKGKSYRAFAMRVVRNIDPDEKGPGIAHRLIVFYAAPLKPVFSTLSREAKLLALSNFLFLLVTTIAVAIVLKRGMAPLSALAREASGISASSWNFHAPEEAYSVRELAPLATALDAALARLEHSFTQQRTFISDAAHELKTAVTIVKSSLQLLSLKERSAIEYQTGIDQSLQDCERMEALVQEMLTLARVEHGDRYGAAPQTSPIRLASVLEAAIQQMDPLSRLRQIQVLYYETGDPLVNISRDECVTLAMNLLLNSIQHSASNSRIEVTLNPSGLSIRDYGEGISPDALPFVFDRFYREDQSRARNTGGAGLGLAICKAIVERHGGKITIQSTVGEGTLVTAWLPVQHQSVGQPESVAHPA